MDAAEAIQTNGQVALRRRSATGEEFTSYIDLMILQLTCEECVELHQLKAGPNGCLMPTSAFLMDLAAKLSAAGVENCTPTEAFRAWNDSYKAVESLKKNMSETPSLPIGSA